MNRQLFFALALTTLAFCFAIRAEDEVKPIKALYITGGGYHDYAKLTPLLTKNIARFANVTFDVKTGEKDALGAMKDPKLGEGYDVIVYNMCFQVQTDKKVPIDEDLMKNAMRVTEEGKPTLMIHCAMHCFRIGNDWAGCCGLTTKVHDGFKGFSTKKPSPDNPIVKFWPDEWKTAGDELYQNIKFPDDSKALLTAYSIDSKKDHVVAWTHTYGKGPVFGTTLGHDMKTAAQDEYQHLLANGILSVCGKLGDDGKPVKGYGGTDSK